MSKLITVLGATGLQGGSVIKALLQAEGYTLRAITRNRQTDTAKTLASQGVEVVEADANDAESLRIAFAGSYAVFAVTNFFEPFQKLGDARKAGEIESSQGINMAKAAATTPTLKHYVWSTLPNSRKISDGQNIVPYYDSKNKVDDYIRSMPDLSQKSTFLWVVSYAQNIMYPFYKPVAVETLDPDTLYQFSATPGSLLWNMAGDITVNVGLFVKAILDQPTKTLRNKIVVTTVESMPQEEVVRVWAAVQGKKGKVLQLDQKAYLDLWPNWAVLMDQSHRLWETRSDAFSGSEKGILTKEDLAVTGLVGTVETFKKLQQK